MRIELLFDKGSVEEIDVQVFRAKDHLVDVRKLVSQHDHWLIEKKHPWQQTQLIMTGVAPYVLLGFDKEGKAVSRMKNLESHRAPFSTFQNSDLMLLLPFDKENIWSGILSIVYDPGETTIRNRERQDYLPWLQKMHADPLWANVRFKKLKNAVLPRIRIPGEYIDEVDREEFVRFEKDRLALFIGTQMGVGPWYPLNGKARGNYLFVILGQSVLSGVVAGAKIYVSIDGEERLVAGFTNGVIV